MRSFLITALLAATTAAVPAAMPAELERRCGFWFLGCHRVSHGIEHCGGFALEAEVAAEVSSSVLDFGIYADVDVHIGHIPHCGRVWIPDGHECHKCDCEHKCKNYH